MATVPTPTPPRQGKPPRKPPRVKPTWARLSLPVLGEQVLEIEAGNGRLTAYWLRPLPSDFGTAYELQRWGDNTVYMVCLGDTDATSHCSCPGSDFHGSCKHRLSLLHLRNQLPQCKPELFENASYKPGHSSSLPF